jgi:DnaJ-class molecular chaperone
VGGRWLCCCSPPDHMDFPTSCPYATLGVDKTASQTEIKEAFRQLSKLTHPDVATAGAASSERFKEISHAASILTNPRKRQHYDDAVKNRCHSRNPYANMMKKSQRASSSSNHPYHRSVVASMLRPRNFILGPIALFATVSALQYIIGSSSEKNHGNHNHHHTNGDHAQPLVQAWLNPETKRYETPAPWDPIYRHLKPQIEYVPREKVHRRYR